MFRENVHKGRKKLENLGRLEAHQQDAYCFHIARDCPRAADLQETVLPDSVQQRLNLLLLLKVYLTHPAKRPVPSLRDRDRANTKKE